MSRSPVAAIVRGWVNLYTRGLAVEARAARRDEIDDDLFCQHEEAADLGRPTRSLDVELGLRLLFGVPADITWRMAQRRRTSAETLNRRLAMHARSLGTVALVAGLSWTVMLTFFVAIGNTIWAGSLGAVTILITLIGAIGFVFTATGLAYRLHDRLGAASAVGAVMMLIGAVAAVAGSRSLFVVVLLPLGSAILVWEVAGAGVVSRLVPIAQVATAVALVVVSLLALPLDGGLTERAATALIFAPFVLSWVALGTSLVRRAPQLESAARGSAA